MLSIKELMLLTGVVSMPLIMTHFITTDHRALQFRSSATKMIQTRFNVFHERSYNAGSTSAKAAKNTTEAS